jgi:hypothetical protein
VPVWWVFEIVIVLKHKHDLQKYIENIWNQLKQGIDNIINKNLPSKQSSVKEYATYVKYHTGFEI